MSKYRMSRYPEEYRLGVCSRYINEDISYAELAKEVGEEPIAIMFWMKEFVDAGEVSEEAVERSLTSSNSDREEKLLLLYREFQMSHQRLEDFCAERGLDRASLVCMFHKFSLLRFGYSDEDVLRDYARTRHPSLRRAS